MCVTTDFFVSRFLYAILITLSLKKRNVARCEAVKVHICYHNLFRIVIFMTSIIFFNLFTFFFSEPKQIKETDGMTDTTDMGWSIILIII